MPFAHSKNSLGEMHDLQEHLTKVAELAKIFASKFGAGEFGYWAGIWHDLGKLHPDFQAYLANPTPARGPDHKGAGSIVASQICEPLAFLVAGHHGGLHSRADLKNWLKEKARAPRVVEAIQLAQTSLAILKPSPQLALPSHVRTELDAEFFLRMVFSALVDADFLDTERHFNSEKADQRIGAPSLPELWVRFARDQSKLSKNDAGRVNSVRHEVYEACVRAAAQPPGFFRLTVPTGGGKTRSGMAFGLQHALANGLDRVIVAIPYTSIIEQTADVYRGIFGDTAVLEHHSAVVLKEEMSDPVSLNDVWSRLAAENWDAPIVVTTTVQLFESLFGRKTTSCRKLHNITRSVVILDEVQTLPVGLLTPILDALRQLVAHYHVSVVLCTATQPALEDSPYLKGLPDVREITPQPARLFAELGDRVQYQLPHAGETWTWSRVAEETSRAEQVLAVVNTKNDALALLDALQDPVALHLSTLLCGAHRREVLHEVKRRLAEGLPCRLVSTQVVEAGVDLDFPFVLRAIGPLDRIVQAAGRCNREGKLAVGRVVVFDPVEGKLPPGVYRAATQTSRNQLLRPGFDFNRPELYLEYFRSLYQVVETDKDRIQELRKTLNYPDVAQRFRMIDDETAAIVVRYHGLDGADDEVDRLLSYVHRQDSKLPRWLLRQLQPYLVNVRTRLIDDYRREGFLNEITSGLWEWLGRYDLVRGLTLANRDAEELVV
jgi:CRISPR-associated endonuclease/helicase Cas3